MLSALATNTALVRLDLEACAFGPDGALPAATALADALRTNTTLTHINLNLETGFGSESGERLFSAIGGPEAASAAGALDEAAVVAGTETGVIVSAPQVKSLWIDSGEFDWGHSGLLRSLERAATRLRHLELSGRNADDGGALAAEKRPGQGGSPRK